MRVSTGSQASSRMQSNLLFSFFLSFLFFFLLFPPSLSLSPSLLALSPCTRTPFDTSTTQPTARTIESQPSTRRHTHDACTTTLQKDCAPVKTISSRWRFYHACVLTWRFDSTLLVRKLALFFFFFFLSLFVLSLFSSSFHRPCVFALCVCVGVWQACMRHFLLTACCRH